jgi:hypothetical protein
LSTAPTGKSRRVSDLPNERGERGADPEVEVDDPDSPGAHIDDQDEDIPEPNEPA